MSATTQALHDLRGDLGTIRLSARMLEAETDLAETGTIALKRIALAIERAERQLITLERAQGVTTSANDVALRRRSAG
jgi:hypothetical protein